MSTTSRRTGSRAIFAAIAAAALLFGMSTPAAADPQDVDGVLTGGHIILGDDKGDPDFEIGLAEEPSEECNPNEDETTVSGVKESDGTLTDIEFDFAPGSIEAPIFGEICSQIVVKNSGQIEGEFDDTDNSIKIPADKEDPTPIVNVIFDGGPCGIYDIDIGQLTGEANQANDEWTLETDTENKFTVPTTDDCGSVTGPIIDSFLSLPNVGQALFEIDIVKS